MTIHRNHISILAFLLVASLAVTLHAQTPDDIIKRAKLLFSDDFNRTAEGDVMEELGHGWMTNIANGSRADLQNDTLVVAKGKAANHSFAVRHDNPFDDGVIRLRFQLFDKHGLKINFNDKSANKVTWAGHIARVVVQPNSVTIQDDKTGTYDLNVRKKRQNKNLDDKEKSELARFLASKRTVIQTPIEIGKWYEITVVNIGPKFEVYIDGASVGSFSSEGLDHQVKQTVALGVLGKVAIDDVSVWSLDNATDK